MPIFEYKCPVHGKFERLLSAEDRPEAVPCPGLLGQPCLKIAPLVHFSVPAKRNPRHGEG